MLVTVQYLIKQVVVGVVCRDRFCNESESTTSPVRAPGKLNALIVVVAWQRSSITDVSPLQSTKRLSCLPVRFSVLLMTTANLLSKPNNMQLELRRQLRVYRGDTFPQCITWG